jgi:hypothetical protein
MEDDFVVINDALVFLSVLIIWLFVLSVAMNCHVSVSRKIIHGIFELT